jgi:hypothetical protein
MLNQLRRTVFNKPIDKKVAFIGINGKRVISSDINKCAFMGGHKRVMNGMGQSVEYKEVLDAYRTGMGLRSDKIESTAVCDNNTIKTGIGQTLNSCITESTTEPTTTNSNFNKSSDLSRLNDGKIEKPDTGLSTFNKGIVKPDIFSFTKYKYKAESYQEKTIEIVSLDKVLEILEVKDLSNLNFVSPSEFKKFFSVNKHPFFFYLHPFRELESLFNA